MDNLSKVDTKSALFLIFYTFRLNESMEKANNQ